MSIEINLSGFLFLFIIATNIASSFFGYKTIGESEPETKLLKINKNPIKFKISVLIILIEHFSIISLALLLFLAFGFYNIILGIIWCISRTGEGLIQIYDNKNYWRLLSVAKQYSDFSNTKKDEIVESGHNILKIKALTFTIAQILFSTGTLAYSILFVIYGIVPIIKYLKGIINSWAIFFSTNLNPYIFKTKFLFKSIK